MVTTCDRCDSPATFHLTEIKGGDKSERHLCEDCARVLQVPQANKELQQLLKSFEPLHSMVRRRQGGGGQSCPECGMTYAEFRQHGRFGCAHDYDVFGKDVMNLLERIHSTTKYSGKHPEGGRVEDGDTVDAASEVRAQLQQAIQAEDYEQAARLRDEIRRLTGDPEGGSLGRSGEG